MKDTCQLLCLLNNSVFKICSLYQRWHLYAIFFCVRFFGHCSCYNIIIIKLNRQSEVGVLRVKNEKFPKITLTKTEVNIMVIVGTILISVGASILFVLKVNSVKDI